MLIVMMTKPTSLIHNHHTYYIRNKIIRTPNKPNIKQIMVINNSLKILHGIYDRCYNLLLVS